MADSTPRTILIVFKNGEKVRYQVSREVNEKMANDLINSANSTHSYEAKNGDGESIIVTFTPYDVLFIG